MVQTFTERRKLGDLLKGEFSIQYNREAETIKNATGGAVTVLDPLGQPLKDVAGQLCFAEAGEEVYCAGLLLEVNAFDALANNAISPKKLVLVRGPAYIDRDQLPTLDVAGVALDLDDLEAALLVLGIVCRREPATTAEQVE
jgi:hypothetical protein